MLNEPAHLQDIKNQLTEIQITLEGVLRLQILTLGKHGIDEKTLRKEVEKVRSGLDRDLGLE